MNYKVLPADTSHRSRRPPSSDVHGLCLQDEAIPFALTARHKLCDVELAFRTVVHFFLASFYLALAVDTNIFGYPHSFFFLEQLNSYDGSFFFRRGGEGVMSCCVGSRSRERASMWLLSTSKQSSASIARFLS